MTSDSEQPRLHSISVVVPVYRGEQTLAALTAELAPLCVESKTPNAVPYRITEVIFVYDNGPDASDAVIRSLAEQYPFVRLVWLSRNFGQHAATLAGIASSSADWVVTLDEDGQHDPADIPSMLDTAVSNWAQVVYAKPLNAAPHGLLRNAASRTAKAVVSSMLSVRSEDFNSFRLILGSVARNVAAYSGSGVYLDVALSWIAGRYATSPVTLRAEARQSGYSLHSLLTHFRVLITSSGTRALRVVSVLGGVFGIVGVLLAGWIVFMRLTTDFQAAGWASVIVTLLVTSGVLMISLGIVAEYIGINVNMAMGKPSYVITADPKDGPLGPRNAPRR